MKKYIVRLLFITLLFSNWFIVKPLAAPNTFAEGVVLFDANSGEILYEKNIHKKFEPASTTKVMTALIVLENSDLNDKVKIGKRPPEEEGSSIGVQKGEVYTVKELLLGLLLESGNDCAVALAEHTSGSVEEFAKLMNKKAKELGANNTNFENPSGLTGKNHYTTPYDLALIMKAAYKNETFLEIARTESYFYKNNPYHDGTEKWAINRNHCLNDLSPYYYKYLVAGKTGYTPEANHTYTSVAKKGDQVLVAAFLNAVDKHNQFLSVGKLFEYGFNTYETKKIASKGEELAAVEINDSITVPLLSTKDIYITKEKGYFENVNRNVVLLDKADLSRQAIKEGDILFKADVNLNKDKVATIALASGIDREYTFKVIVTESISNLSKNRISLILTIIVIFTLVAFIFFKSKKTLQKRALKRKYSHLKTKR